MGEVYRPEDVIDKRGRTLPDLSPGIPSKPISRDRLDELIREVRELKSDVEKIKVALRSRGISI